MPYTVTVAARLCTISDTGETSGFVIVAVAEGEALILEPAAAEQLAGTLLEQANQARQLTGHAVNLNTRRMALAIPQGTA
ncbi:MAG: hypothetical protein ACXW3D_01220 [Caulobacteraceae bacterium]